MTGTRTSIYIDSQLLLGVRIYSWNMHRPVSGVVSEALQEFLIKEGYLSEDGEILKKKR